MIDIPLPIQQKIVDQIKTEFNRQETIKEKMEGRSIFMSQKKKYFLNSLCDPSYRFLHSSFCSLETLLINITVALSYITPQTASLHHFSYP